MLKARMVNGAKKSEVAATAAVGVLAGWITLNLIQKGAEVLETLASKVIGDIVKASKKKAA